MKAAVALLLLALAEAAGQQPVAEFTATSANVSEPGKAVTIRIIRWSTDDERTPVLAALNPAPPVAAAPAAGAAVPAAGRAVAAGRGRGRGRGGAQAALLTPIAAFTAAISRAPTIGYVWTSDITGYAIKYAWHAPASDGGERIVIATNRRLGAYTDAWKPLAAKATDYDFTLIELRMGPQGLIEGKTSLANGIVVDAEAKTVALENYAASPASLAATSAAGRSPRPSR